MQIIYNIVTTFLLSIICIYWLMWCTIHVSGQLNFMNYLTNVITSIATGTMCVHCINSLSTAMRGGHYNPTIRVSQSFKGTSILGVKCPHGTSVLWGHFSPMVKASQYYKGILVPDWSNLMKPQSFDWDALSTSVLKHLHTFTLWLPEQVLLYLRNIQDCHKC